MHSSLPPLLTAPIGMAFYVATAEESNLLWPMAFVLRWIAIRFSIPRSGIQDRRISADAFQLRMLYWLAFISLLCVALFALDTTVLGQR